MSEENRVFSVGISIEEWESILSWMYTSLAPTESEAEGHFLLEIDGPRRTWVASDGDQMTVLHVDGPSPKSNFDRTEPLVVLVNSRFFRAKTPEDVTLTVRETERGREQLLRGEGFEFVLREHPGPFPDWKASIASLAGKRIEVDSRLLTEACHTAEIVPWGVKAEYPVVAWMSVVDGRLLLDAPWIGSPHTKVFIDLKGDHADTVPVLIRPSRLKNLLRAIDSATITLTLPDSPLDLIGVSYDNYRALLMPVDRWAHVKERVEDLLCNFLRVESISPDSDGDYLVTTPEGHEVWVRLHTEFHPVSVQVFSVLAAEVPCSSDLLMELNSINASAPHVKVIWADGAIMAEVDIVAEELDQSELSNALIVVQDTAERYRTVLEAFFSDPEAAD